LSKPLPVYWPNVSITIQLSLFCNCPFFPKHSPENYTNTLLAPCKEILDVLDSGFDALDFGFQLLDSSLCYPVVSGTWIQDSRFLELERHFEFQSPGFHIPQAKFSGCHKQNFPGFRNFDSLTWCHPSMQLDRYNNQPISFRLHLEILGAMLNLI